MPKKRKDLASILYWGIKGNLGSLFMQWAPTFLGEWARITNSQLSNVTP